MLFEVLLQIKRNAVEFGAPADIIWCRTMTLNIAYFVHDLSDAAVSKRVRMLVLGGASVTVIGFRRSARAISPLHGARVIDLGETRDAALTARTLSVAKAMTKLKSLAGVIRDADVIMARNLEMLALARRAQRLSKSHASLVYECLDIHRLLLSQSAAGRAVRAVETSLWKHADRLVTSSAAFVRNYFAPRGFEAPIQITENKLLDPGPRPLSLEPRLAMRQPWRIGLLGMLRCRKSFDLLSDLARNAQGAVEIIIRGRPSPAVFPNFEALVAQSPHVSFHGSYRNPEDLASIYEDVHFSWAVDFYEEGENSAWLLPNRIYEGSFYGAVPIALSSVETGAWLKPHAAGVLLGGSPAEDLKEFFNTLDPAQYAELAAAVARIPNEDLADGADAARAFVQSLAVKEKVQATSKALAVAGQPDKPSVLAVIPCLNEATHIETVASNLIAESTSLDMTIVIADGGSTDGTVEIARRMSAAHPNVILMPNEKRIQSAGVNRAAELYGSSKDYLIRVDAHCGYQPRYCASLLAEREKSGADCVVVSMVAEGSGCFQRAAATAQNSKLGNGGSAHRSAGEGRWIDHGHHALMSLAAFRAVGGYDETFTHNEDAELDTRLRKAGFKIWLSGKAPIVYFPRASASGLFRQYVNYGRGRARTMLKHRARPKLRQSLPLGVAPAVVLAALSPIAPIAAAPALIWAGLCLGYGAGLGLRQRDFGAGCSGIAAMIMHFGWSAGFILGSAKALTKPSSASVAEDATESKSVLAIPTLGDVIVATRQTMQADAVTNGSTIEDRPLVSVVMANFNGAAYIGDAIDSVLRQTIKNLELIVADDASIDGSLAIARRFADGDSRIKIIESAENTGPSGARNRGLAAAAGRWIAVMDSDDVMHPARLETLIALADNDGATIVADDLAVFYSDGSKPAHGLLTGRYAMAPFWANVAVYIKLNTFYSDAPGLGYLKPLIKRAILDETKIGYDDTLRIGEDYDFILRLLLQGARYRIYPRQLYYYRKHPSSVSHRLSPAAARAMLEADLRFQSSLGLQDAEVLAALAARIRSVQTAVAFNELIAALKDKQFLDAVALVLRRPRLLLLLKEPAQAAIERLKAKIRNAEQLGRPLPLQRFTMTKARSWLAIRPARLFALAALTCFVGATSFRLVQSRAAPADERILQPIGTVRGHNRFAEKGSTFDKTPERVFVIKKGTGIASVPDFDPSKGDKLRIEGFGIVNLTALQSHMSESGGDVVLAFDDGSSVRLINTAIDALTGACLQLELDRSRLVKTFGDEFDSFSWYAEDLDPKKDRQGIWRTNYGWGPPTAESSRSLGGNRQVYTDPAFQGTSPAAFGLNPFHVSNGILEIWAERAPKDLKPFLWGREYLSGLITSKYSFSQLYGVFEIRAKMPKGRGFWPAFWLLPSDSTWPPEIDIFEVLTKDPSHLFTTVHVTDDGVHNALGIDSPVADTTEDFHQYAVDWRRDTIRWYFDGVEVGRIPTPATMHKPMYILANLAVGGDWAGEPDASTPFPGVLAIDWIRAYRAAPSEAGF